MPSFRDMQKLYGNKTMGRQLKDMSDMVMQETFDNDLATRQCYLFDYYHDDQKEILGGKNYRPELNKYAIPVKLKFMIKEYKSASKDDPEAHIMFQPDDWNSDRLVPDWFDIGYGKWGVHFPVGLFIAIPDDRWIYHKYLIFYDEAANQFPKFGVMRCNYLFQWITDDGVNRFKRFMCGVQRTQNSYTSWDIVSILCSRLAAIGNIAVYPFVYAGTAYRAVMPKQRDEICSDGMDKIITDVQISREVSNRNTLNDYRLKYR